MKAQLKKNLKRVQAVGIAAVLVVGCGALARDASLKATDGEELPDVPAVVPEAAEQAPTEIIVNETDEYILSEVVPSESDSETPAESYDVEAPDDAAADADVTAEQEPADDGDTVSDVTEPETDGAEGEIGEEEEVPKSIRIWYEYYGELVEGLEITICSEVKGYSENAVYCWQYSVDGIDWFDAVGGNGPFYTFVLNAETTNYMWRLSVEEPAV